MIMSGMKKMPVFFFLFVPIFLTSARVQSQNIYMDSAKAAQLMFIQELLLDDDYFAGDTAYLSYIDRYPDDPAGYLFRAGLLMADMTDKESDYRSIAFTGMLDSARSIIAPRLDTCSDKTAAWMYLLRGHADAYEAMWESRFGSFFSAISLGMSAKGEYDRGLARDSGNYDLYAGLGAYHYWKSVKAGLLRSVGIFRNDIQRGIDELYLAADSSLIHRAATRTALIWIWLDRKEYDSVISIATELSQRYPGSRTLLWPIAQAWFSKNEYDSALSVYSELRRRLIREPGNYVNLIECDYHICKCLGWLSRSEDVKVATRRFYEYADNIPEETRRRESSRINYLKRIANR